MALRGRRGHEQTSRGMGNYDDFWKQQIDEARAADPHPEPASPATNAVAAPTGTTVLAAPPVGDFWAPPSPAPASVASAPPTWGTPTGDLWTAPKPASALQKYGIGLIAVVVAIGLAGFVYNKFWSLQPLHTPQMVAGELINRAPSTTAMTKDLVETMKDEGADRAIAGVYGDEASLRAGQPFYVIGAASDVSDHDQGDNLADLVSGMTDDGQFRASGGQQTLRDSRGRTVTCQALTGPIPVSACVWSHKNRIGVVVGFSVSTTDLAPITGDVRDAVL